MSDSDLSVGWIGAGRMGAAMAARLAGPARTSPSGTAPAPRPRRSPTTAAGSPTRSPTSATATSSSRWSPRPADLEQVLLGEGGLLADPGHVPGAVVDCSTVSTETSERDARGLRRARGVDFLAAPVSGNGKVVAAGLLTPGRLRPEETYHKVAPTARATSARRVDVRRRGRHRPAGQDLPQPDARRGHPVVAEITVLAEKGGMSRAAFLEFLNNCVMGSTFTRYKSPAFVHLDYTPTFTPVLLRKDFDLGLAAARRARRADAGRRRRPRSWCRQR